MKIHEIPNKIEKLNESNQKQSSNTFLAKIHRELNLLNAITDKTYQGFKQTDSTETEHPLQLTEKFVAGAALGIVLTALTRNPESLGLLGKITVNYGGYALGGLGALNIFNQLEKPIVNTWDGIKTPNAEITKIGNDFGGATFNLGVMGLGGTIGSLSTQAFLNSDTLTTLTALTGNTFKSQNEILADSLKNIVKIQASGDISLSDALLKYPDKLDNLTPNTTQLTLTSNGTGFILNDGQTIVTNFHCIDNTPNISIQTIDGKIIPATLFRANPDSDLALLKLNSPDNEFKGLSLAKTSLRPGVKFNSAGFPGSETTPLYQEGKILKPVESIQGNSLNLASFKGQPGLSGSPLLKDGKVVGILSQSNKLGQVSRFVPISELKALIEQGLGKIN